MGSAKRIILPTYRPQLNAKNYFSQIKDLISNKSIASSLKNMKKLTDKEKIDKIITLLIDKSVGVLAQKKQIQGDDEEFGALVFAGWAFKEACKIAEK